ncbi:MAG: hypothetical protein IJ106_01725 [Parasporobacterium sp.]|nr:hypothetical protein [Parasporobacterium sp.]
MTTIKDLPIGARICESKSGTVFVIADHHHTGWNGTTVIADRVCLISCIDAAEPDNPDKDIAGKGCNRYSLSNINQWLNSAADNWYQPQHEFDAPPREELISMRQEVFESRLFDPDGTFPPPYSYLDQPGYLARFAQDFREAILVTQVPCFGPNDPDIIHYGPPVAENVPCRAFLPSASETGLEDEVRWEGYLIRLFLDPRMRMCAPENAAIHKEVSFDYKQSAVALWLRSPLGGSSCMGKIYQVEHKFGDVVGATLMLHPVNYAAGIRPLMNLDDSLRVTGRSEDGIYLIQA